MDKQPDKHDDSELQKTAGVIFWTRQIWRYALIALLSVFITYMTWAVCCGIDAQIAVVNDAQLASSMQNLSISALTTKEMLSIMQQIQPQMHWFADAFISAVLAFSIVGWLVGRWCNYAGWAGAMPLFVLLVGLNPAYLGGGYGGPQINGLGQLTSGESLAILLLQIFVAHCVAAVVYIKRARHRVLQLISKTQQMQESMEKWALERGVSQEDLQKVREEIEKVTADLGKLHERQSQNASENNDSASADSASKDGADGKEPSKSERE